MHFLVQGRKILTNGRHIQRPARCGWDLFSRKAAGWRSSPAFAPHRPASERNFAVRILSTKARRPSAMFPAALGETGTRERLPQCPAEKSRRTRGTAAGEAPAGISASGKTCLRIRFRDKVGRDFVEQPACNSGDQFGCDFAHGIILLCDA